jgi:hypothetical protein
MPRIEGTNAKRRSRILSSSGRGKSIDAKAKSLIRLQQLVVRRNDTRKTKAHLQARVGKVESRDQELEG